MNKNTEKAKLLLLSGDYTCVLVKDDSVITSNQRGVKPLLEMLEKGEKKGFSSADKVVGKAASMLYILLGVDEVYAQIISKPALEVFHNAKLPVYYGELVERIENRTKTGFCPMEEAVFGENNPKTCLELIKNKLKTL